MKHWYRTLGAKVVCFVLCVTFLCLTALGITGAALMIAGEFYVLPKEYVVDSTYRSMLQSESNNIIWYHLDDDEYHGYERFDYNTKITNIRYSVVDPDGNVIGNNCSNENFSYSFKWIYFKDSAGEYTEVDYYWDGAEDTENADIFTVNMSVDTGFPVMDEYYLSTLLFDLTYALLYWIYPIILLSLGITVASFVILMCASGRKPQDDELHTGPLYKVPIDLLLAFLITVFSVVTMLIVDAWWSEVLIWVFIILIICAAINVFVGVCMSIAIRIKGKTLFSNTLVWIILRLIGKAFYWTFKGIFALFCAIPIVWRTFLFIIANTVLDIFFLCIANGDLYVALFFWILKSLCVNPALVYVSLMLRKLEKGGRALAKGDLSFRVNTKGMFWDFRRHGENLNSISKGMSLAVEDRLKSERMKTELITNVSHDIKTPITSIINYSSLISNESCNCENHREYSEVLVRKSEHLKRLLDDLVEASKATTGNLEICPEPCDGTVLVSQAAGEYIERCKSAELELICNIPEESIMIMADQRRIWRIFENLLSNACKYSLPNSRVYLSVEKVSNNAVFSIKNTSLSPLNISPDELTQRFVRGDSSRTTEGNGLGLSIAKSLTELQGGKMEITIDGDLFKVTVSFPVI